MKKVMLYCNLTILVIIPLDDDFHACVQKVEPTEEPMAEEEPMEEVVGRGSSRRTCRGRGC